MQFLESWESAQIWVPLLICRTARFNISIKLESRPTMQDRVGRVLSMLSRRISFTHGTI